MNTRQRYTDRIKAALDHRDMQSMPREEYLEALEDIEAHLEASIEACKSDIKRDEEMGR